MYFTCVAHCVTVPHGLLLVNDSNTCYIRVKIFFVCIFEKLIFKNTYVPSFFFFNKNCVLITQSCETKFYEKTTKFR